MEKRYLYRSNLALLLLGLVLAGAFVGLCIFEALTIDRGVSFRRMGFILSEGHAKILLWIIAAIFSYAFLLGLLSVLRALGPPRYIQLSDRFLVTPKSPRSSRILEIPLNKITSIQSATTANKEILTIRYHGGKVAIPEVVFEDEFKFNNFKAALADFISKSKDANKSSKKGAQTSRASS